MTDANLVLGRLIPDYFPHIFGESEDQPLDKARATAAFMALTQQVCITMLKQLNSKHMIHSTEHPTGCLVNATNGEINISLYINQLFYLTNLGIPVKSSEAKQ